VSRLATGDVACWVLKTTRPPEVMAPGWAALTPLPFDRCVRRSYRLDLQFAAVLDRIGEPDLGRWTP
jgi:hypothetical protein